jgi:transposase-like protein
VIYTTNATESLHSSLRQVLKNRGAFLNDEAIMKLLYLALHNVAKRWTQPIHDWKAALNQFVILYGERVLA